jgi:hypothetical protein
VTRSVGNNQQHVRIGNVCIEQRFDGTLVVYHRLQLGMAIEIPERDVDDLLVALDAVKGWRTAAVRPLADT